MPKTENALTSGGRLSYENEWWNRIEAAACIAFTIGPKISLYGLFVYW